MEKILYNLSNYYKSLVSTRGNNSLYSKFIYFITLKLALYVRSKKINEVDKKSVRRYFDNYGTEATMNNYNFTVETLIEILGFNINEIDLNKFMEFKGK